MFMMNTYTQQSQNANLQKNRQRRNNITWLRTDRSGFTPSTSALTLRTDAVLLLSKLVRLTGLQISTREHNNS